MANYKLVVLSNPVDGREAEYNDWYTNIHLGDVTAVPGIVSAQRFKLIDGLGREAGLRYLAIYEVESDAPHDTVAEMLSRRGSDAMVVSDAIDVDHAIAGLFEACSPVVTAN